MRLDPVHFWVSAWWRVQMWTCRSWGQGDLPKAMKLVIIGSKPGLSVLRWVPIPSPLLLWTSFSHWVPKASCHCDADPGQQDPLWLQYSNTHGLQKSCGGKGTAQPLSQEESASESLGHSLQKSTLTLALTGFYCFSRPLTSKKVLLYYAKVCFGWLSFADKGEDVSEYIKGGYLQCKGRSGWIGYAPYLEGLAQILGR